MALSIATATVAATAGGLSLGWRSSLSEQVKEALVSPESDARSMGAIECRMRGGLLRARRHVSLIGHLLVVGRARGYADRVYSLEGARVDVSHASGTIEIISPSGRTLATFWPASEMEMMKLSARLSEHGFPSGVESESLTDSWWLNMDAEIVDWEQQISKALDDPLEEEPEWIDLIDLNSRCMERERTASDLVHDWDGRRASVTAPAPIHLSKKQIAELTSVIKHEGCKISKLQHILDKKQEKWADEDEDEQCSTTAGGPVSPFSDLAWDATYVTDYSSSRSRSSTFACEGDGAVRASVELAASPRDILPTPRPCSRQTSTLSTHSNATAETQLWTW